jgi:hypothetical protein
LAVCTPASPASSSAADPAPAPTSSSITAGYPTVQMVVMVRQ